MADNHPETLFTIFKEFDPTEYLETILSTTQKSSQLHSNKYPFIALPLSSESYLRMAISTLISFINSIRNNPVPIDDSNNIRLRSPLQKDSIDSLCHILYLLLNYLDTDTDLDTYRSEISLLEGLQQLFSSISNYDCNAFHSIFDNNEEFFSYIYYGFNEIRGYIVELRNHKESHIVTSFLLRISLHIENYTTCVRVRNPPHLNEMCSPFKDLDLNA
jgi:hypothetical protein